eukprot:m.111918 g.111918  ORF g.111918 m.111918 type:complete len:54 (-) comp22803_c0_seq1:600-761(-)
MDGLGSYSSNLAPSDKQYANFVGFQLNWDLSGTVIFMMEFACLTCLSGKTWDQ